MSNSRQLVRPIYPTFPLSKDLCKTHWLPGTGSANLNSRAVTWEFSDKSAQQGSTAITDVLENLSEDQREKLLIPEFTIVQADAQKIHVRAWTKKEWLDALDVSFQPTAKGCTAKAKCYATGFLPTSIPGAPVLNIGLALFPFVSPGPNGKKLLQDFRLEKLEDLVRSRVKAL